MGCFIKKTTAITYPFQTQTKRLCQSLGHFKRHCVTVCFFVFVCGITVAWVREKKVKKKKKKGWERCKDQLVLKESSGTLGSTLRSPITVYWPNHQHQIKTHLNNPTSEKLFFYPLLIFKDAVMLISQESKVHHWKSEREKTCIRFRIYNRTRYKPNPKLPWHQNRKTEKCHSVAVKTRQVTNDAVSSVRQSQEHQAWGWKIGRNHFEASHQYTHTHAFIKRNHCFYS